jgi:hypothetical protein
MKNAAHLSIVVLLVLSLALTACNSPSASSGDATDDPVSGLKTLEDIKVPANFKWNTFTNTEFRVTGSETSSIRVVSKTGTVYHYSNLIAGSEYVFKTAIPDYEKTVFLHYMGQKVEVDVTGNRIHHVFESAQTFGNNGTPSAANKRF